MKTTHDISKASEAKFAWWCYAIWWLDALALLVIMIIMSAFRLVQDRRSEISDDGHDGGVGHALAGLPSTV